jgi:hypothetical protein
VYDRVLVIVYCDADYRSSQTEEGRTSSAKQQRSLAPQWQPPVDVERFLNQLDDLIKTGRIRVGRGHTGRVYLSYFDERYSEDPFRCYKLREDGAKK